MGMKKRKKSFLLPTVSLLWLILLFGGICLFSPIGITVSAQSAENADTAELWENIRELIAGLDLSALDEYISSVDEIADWNVADKIVEFISGGNVDYDDVFSTLFSLFLDSVKDFLPSFAVICAVSLTCALLNAVRSETMQDSVSKVIFYAGYCSVLVVVLAKVIVLFGGCMNCMQSMRKQMEIVFPLLLTLMAASGGGVSVAVYRPAVAFLSGGVSSLLTEAVLPFTIVIIVFTMVSGLNDHIKLNGFISFFRNANKWIIGVCVTVFGIFLSVQGLTAAAYDGISLRAAKYAISNSVPIVGGFLSNGFDLVLAGSVLIKNSVGVIGIVLLVLSVLPALSQLIGFSLCLRLSSAVCEPMGEERISRFLTGLGGSTGYLVACLLCVAFLYFLTVLLLICSAGVIF